MLKLQKAMPAPATYYASPDQAPKASICIVGGTNVAHALALSEHVSASFTIETPFGVSPIIYFGETDGVPFYHITLHGSPELSGVAEQDVLLRVWSALHQLQVSDVLGGATAGSINEKYKLGDWVVGDDFVDFNIDRQRSIAAAVLGAQTAARILPRYVPADDPVLRKILVEETAKVAGAENVHAGGVIVQAAGGRFETAAEITMFKRLGGDLVTMNVPTEMAYARQVNINYASLIAISNPAEGLGTWAWTTLSDLYPKFHAQSIEIYLGAVKRINELPERRRIGDTLRVHPEFD
jgi:5'-methylthioadenosine phosphorylase